jgi:phosphoglycerol transferase MdoB-like AlkP superfamily enzyme
MCVVLILLAEAAPVLVVLAGLFVLRSKPSPAAAGTWLDVFLFAWCAVSLIAKQIVFMSMAHLDWRVSAVWGIVLGGAMPAFLLLLIANRRWRAGTAWLIVLVASLLMTIDRLYFAWFGDVLPAVGWLAFWQVRSLSGGIRELLNPADVLQFADLVLAVPLLVAAWPAARGFGDRRHRLTAALVAAVVAGIAAWQTAAPVRANRAIVTQRFSNLSLVEAIGPMPFHALDAWLTTRRRVRNELATDAAFDEVLHWLESRAPLRAGTGPMFGAAAGRNLIVIQVESLQEPIVNMRINGQEVMPNLRALASSGIYFSDVVDQTDEGRTSDAEWLMLTSQLPESQGAAAFADSGNHLVGLPSVLASRGYDSFSAVAFGPGFWNRRVMHRNLGFFHSYFAADFAAGENIGWGLNDRDFLQQMVPRLTAARQPFAAWMITLSLHYPFAEFPDAHKVLNVQPFDKTGFGNYLHGMHYFDQALGEFVDALSRAGLLERSMLVVTGDHSAGFRWQPEIAHAMGFANDIAHWTDAERVPMMIRIAGAAPQTISRPVGQVDFAPTILGLLGIDASSLPYVGRNQLGMPGEEPIIRRKGSWEDGQHLFLLRGPTNGSHCYERTTLQDVPLADCDSAAPIAVRKALTQRRMQELDMQQRLYARLSADAAVRH